MPEGHRAVGELANEHSGAAAENLPAFPGEGAMRCKSLSKHGEGFEGRPSTGEAGGLAGLTSSDRSRLSMARKGSRFARTVEPYTASPEADRLVSSGWTPAAEVEAGVPAVPEEVRQEGCAPSLLKRPRPSCQALGWEVIAKPGVPRTQRLRLLARNRQSWHDDL
jgi:hypothetical protein